MMDAAKLLGQNTEFEHSTKNKVNTTVIKEAEFLFSLH
jgi:hypothetical protein